MKKFAFIVNPGNIKQFKSLWPHFRIIPDFIAKLSLRNLPPFKISHIRNIKSSQGKKIEGWLIVSPLLKSQGHNLEKNFIIDNIIAAGNRATRLGADIAGLGSLDALGVDKEYNTITENLKIPVISGSVLTAWSVFEAIYRVAKVKDIKLKESHLAVIGATTSLGSLCAKKLSDYISKLTLVGQQMDKLEALKETILSQNSHPTSPQVIIAEDAAGRVKDADIVININNSTHSTFDIEEIKPNAVLCDVFSPGNIKKRETLSKNITVIQGGLVKLPFADKASINIGLPKGIIYASLAETMLLTFTEKFISYSLGENINPDKLEELADLSVQHGFEVWVPEAPVL